MKKSVKTRVDLRLSPALVSWAKRFASTHSTQRKKMTFTDVVEHALWDLKEKIDGQPATQSR